MMPPLYALAKLTVGTVLTTAWPMTVEGLRHLPDAGGAILASNHLSVADELFLAAVVRRHVAFWAKSEYFSAAGPAGWLARATVRGMGAIPVDRGGGRAALTAFDAAIPVLRAGGLIAVYPEGTRSPDGRLFRGRTGVVRLAQQAGVPMIPVGTIGTDRVQPIGSWIPRRHPVTIRFGAPITVAGRIQRPSDVRALTDEVMARIHRLTGQEYVPNYAPRRVG